MSNRAILFALLLTLPIILGFAQENAAKPKEASSGAARATIAAAAEMQWAQGPPSLPAGAQMVVLDGDPRQKGSFTLRLKMPAGYKIPPHTHPTAERVTVISGAVRLGVGEKLDESVGHQMKAGDFAVVPPGVPHFAISLSEAVLQIHSEGPFERKFVDPAEDAAAGKNR